MFDINNYYFNGFAVPVFLVAVLLFLIGSFIFTQNIRSKNNITFSCICLFTCIWLFGNTAMYCSRSVEQAHNWYRWVSFFGVSNIAVSIYAFSVAWLGDLRREKRFIQLSYLISFAFYLLAQDTRYGVPGMRHFWFGFYPIYGPYLMIFTLLFTLYYSMALWIFFKAWKAETHFIHKKQIKFVTIAYAITFLGIGDMLLKFVPLPFPPVGFIMVFLWLPVVAYSIIRYKIMDIETVIHKTLMWGALSSVVFLPLALFLILTRDWLIAIGPVPSAFAGVGIFILFSLYGNWIQPHIDHLFQRQKHDLEMEFAKFNDNLVHLRGLNELIRFLVNTIHNVLYAQKTLIFLESRQGNFLERVDGIAEGSMRLDADDLFLRQLERSDQYAMADFVDMDPQFETVKEEARKIFQQLDAKVIMPLILNQRLIGLIALGQKSNLKSYRGSEIKFLNELRRAATIALSNTLTLIAMQENLRKWNQELEEKVKQRTEELEKAQEQLIQAEKLATIGTMSGGVAHEINNPLTAVLANAQMLKMTVTDKDDLECIDLIEQGAKRCQVIVQKLMKYSRKSTREAEAQEVNLNQVLNNVLGFMKHQVELENIEMKTGFEDLPFIRGVSNELEQVFTNLILNAKDAIQDMRDSGGTIEIKSYQRNGCVCASVRDDGKGIDPENIKKIFDPFFTTKDVGKGTGLGLSVTFGIVEKHGGKITVESEPGKGSLFTVTLPKEK